MLSLEELLPRAIAAQREGDFSAAERDYREILTVEPHHAIALSNLAVILGRRGELPDAIGFAEAAVRADPNLHVAHFNLGNLYRRLSRWPEAAECYRRVIRLRSDFALAHLNLGLTCSQLGDWAAAIEHFRVAVDLQPTIPDGLHNLGESLIQAGRNQEAIDALHAAINRAPALPRNYFALGRALSATGRLDEAIHALERAIQLQPEHALARNLLGIVLDRAGRWNEAHANFQEATRIQPNFPGAWANLGISLCERGQAREALDALTRSYELNPEAGIGSGRLWLMLASSSIDSAQRDRERADWAARYEMASPLAEAVHTPLLDSHKIQIGYVLGEFQTPPTASFLEALLSHHNRERFRTVCYSSAATAVAERLAHRADSWRSIANMDDTAAGAAIRSDGLDILVDLQGHAFGNRILLFAAKPARIQLSLFGYPDATGLKAIDFRISDDIADPPETDLPAIAEKVLRLPNFGRLYVPPRTEHPPTPLPAVERGTLTFGYLGNAIKLSDLCIATWAKILKSLPNSRIVLQAGRSMEGVRYVADCFAAQGIDRGRLALVYRMNEADYFRAYESIDLALDPFPFNGWTTTCDALWMGVPVLSVAGKDCRSRQGLSVLSKLGLADFAAESPEKLVSLAAIWAEQLDALADLRAGLREVMLQSPIADAAAYVRNLESAYCSALNSPST